MWVESGENRKSSSIYSYLGTPIFFPDIEKVAWFVYCCAGQAKYRFKVPKAAILMVAAQILPTCPQCPQVSGAQKIEPTAVLHRKLEAQTKVEKKINRLNSRGDICSFVEKGRAESSNSNMCICAYKKKTISPLYERESFKD